MSNTSRMLSATVHGELARSAFRPSPPGWLSSWPTALASAVTALIPGTGPCATKLQRHSDLRRSERRGQHRQDRETLMNVAKWVPCVSRAALLGTGGLAAISLYLGNVALPHAR